jgi:hypothetical protein
MYYTINKQTPLITDDLMTTALGELTMWLSEGSKITDVKKGLTILDVGTGLNSSTDPPQTQAGFTKVLYNDQAYWIDSSALTPVVSPTSKIGMAVLAGLAVWFLLFRK